jgi:hypothetical protein
MLATRGSRRQVIEHDPIDFHIIQHKIEIGIRPFGLLVASPFMKSRCEHLPVFRPDSAQRRRLAKKLLPVKSDRQAFVRTSGSADLTAGKQSDILKKDPREGSQNGRVHFNRVVI